MSNFESALTGQARFEAILKHKRGVERALQNHNDGIDVLTEEELRVLKSLHTALTRKLDTLE